MPHLALLPPWPITIGVAAALVVATGLGIGLTHGAGAAPGEAGSGRDALPVATLTVEKEPGYRVEQRFTGRIEPARQTRLAFERPGLVTAVLVEEGDAVRAGQVIAKLDPAALDAQLDRLEAQRRQAAADLELATLTTERQRTLLGQGHAAEQRFDEVRLRAEAAAARLAETEAAIRATRVDLDKSVLTAPFDGHAGARRVDEGAVVEAGMPVLDLLETARPMARVGVAPDLAAALATAANLRLYVGGRPVPARLNAIRPDLTTSTRTVTALFDLTGPAPLTFGETVELRVERIIAAPGAWVPLMALVEGERGLWSVFTVEKGPDGPVVARESVEVLHVAEGRAFVQGPLEDGAKLVAAGPHRVVPGQPVTLLAGAE